MLIRPATLSRLEKRLRPDEREGMVWIERESRVADGAGWKTGFVRFGPYPARISFTPFIRSREESIANRPGANHRYLVELPTYTDVRSTDVVLYTAKEWQPSTQYQVGQLVRPHQENGFLYRVKTSGLSNLSVSSWPTNIGATFSDGTVTWENIGVQLSMEVIEVAQVDSYELVRDVYCDLRQ